MRVISLKAHAAKEESLNLRLDRIRKYIEDKSVWADMENLTEYIKIPDRELFVQAMKTDDALLLMKVMYETLCNKIDDEL